MQKPGKAVIENTVYIAIWQVILTGLMQSVYLIVDKWGLSVLFGGLLGSAVAVANFFAMAMTVQKSVTLDQKEAMAKMKLSQSMRFMVLVIVTAVGCYFFDPIATVIPLLFPRFAITLYPLFKKKKEGPDK